MSRVDSWHVVSAGGSDFVAEFSAADEFAMLAGGGCFLSRDPAVLLEAAECGGLDCLREEA